jgi:hypothetical protein
VARRTPEEIERAMSDTTNLADSGAIVACLSIASQWVEPRRRKIYIDAHRRHADRYAIQFQLASGAFTNGRWHGRDTTTPYSVATGAQGMSFAALYAVTGEPSYIQAAERAVRFLLSGWQEDGRPTFHDPGLDLYHVQRATDFGNIYYYHEAILWVWNWTGDDSLKQWIRTVYGWHVLGERGLLATRQHDFWWRPSPSTWENSKAGAMPMVLIHFGREMDPRDDVFEAVRRAIAFLSRPEFAARIGIRVDPLAPWGNNATPATGFAGLTLAEYALPGLLYLKEPAGDGDRPGIRPPR